MWLQVRWTRVNGPACAARMLETAAVMAGESAGVGGQPRPLGRRWASARTRGVETQTRRQRQARTAVRAASLMGRRATMLRRRASGRRLMRSTRSEEGQAGLCAAREALPCRGSETGMPEMSSVRMKVSSCSVARSSSWGSKPLRRMSAAVSGSTLVNGARPAMVDDGGG
jgi:hypothetical protein